MERGYIKLSGKYDEALDIHSWNSQSIILNKINRNSTILEFGCANGRLTKYLKENLSCNITIVEIDAAAGHQASKFADRCFIGKELGDIEKYKWVYSEEKFDYIIFADVLEHLVHPEEVLIRCKDVLKPFGKILISIPNVANYSIIEQLLHGEFNYTEVGLLDNTHLRFFTKKTFTKLLKSIGYMPEEIISLQAYTKPINNISLSEKICKLSSESQNYQYIYSVVKDNKKSNFLEKVLDSRMQYKIYFSKDSELFNEKDMINEKYQRENSSANITLPSLDTPYYVRFDPIETSCVIKLNSVFIETKLGKKEVSLKNTNADYSTENVYFFSKKDPQFVFEITKNYNSSQLTINFEMLEYDIRQYFLDLLSFFNEYHTKTLLSNDKKDSKINYYEEQIKKKEEDIKNKEKFIGEIKSSKLFKIIFNKYI